MKNFIICLLFFLPATGIFQMDFPRIESNASQEDKSESIIYGLFNGKSDFLIAYSEESYWWSDKKNYQAIIFNDNTWKKVIVSSRRKKDGSWTKPKIQAKAINPKKANEFILKLTAKSFWDLQREELNLSKQENDDATETKYSIADGVNYKFEILTRENFRIIESYEPEYFLEKMPEQKKLGVFVNCRNDFQNFIK